MAAVLQTHATTRPTGFDEGRAARCVSTYRCSLTGAWFFPRGDLIPAWRALRRSSFAALPYLLENSLE